LYILLKATVPDQAKGLKKETDFASIFASWKIGYFHVTVLYAEKNMKAFSVISQVITTPAGSHFGKQYYGFGKNIQECFRVFRPLLLNRV